MAKIEPEMEPQMQVHLETVHSSDNSTEEYQNPGSADKTGLETEIHVHSSDISQGKPFRWCHWLKALGRPGSRQ